MGPLLARMGRASCPPPGGDAIGIRPLDVHLAGFRMLGATVDAERRRLRRARGRHAARRPRAARLPERHGHAERHARGDARRRHDDDHQRRQRAGDRQPRADAQRAWARTSAAPARTSCASKASRELARHRAHASSPTASKPARSRWPARSPAATSCSKTPCRSTSMRCSGRCRKRAPTRARPTPACTSSAATAYKAVSAQALPYPGLASDLQPQLAAFLTQARGREHDPRARLRQPAAVHQRAAQDGRERRGRRARRRSSPGPTTLRAAPVSALDVRAGSAVVLAALVAEGTTEISDVYHIDRAHEDLHGKLRALGASIERA